MYGPDKIEKKCKFVYKKTICLSQYIAMHVRVEIHF